MQPYKKDAPWSAQYRTVKTVFPVPDQNEPIREYLLMETDDWDQARMMITHDLLTNNYANANYGVLWRGSVAPILTISVNAASRIKVSL